MEFKEFGKEDLDNASELFVSIFNGAPWNDKWTFKTARKSLKDFIDTPKFIGITCYKQKELVGFLVGNREQWCEGEVFYLKEMGIKNNFQGKGIGTELIKSLREKLKGTKVNGIYLLTEKRSNAEKFYLKNGFNINEEMILMDGGV